jgi:excisionase family DNA binding protein
MTRLYYTTFEASRFLGVSLPTVVNWIKANRLQAHRTPGGHRRIARDELASFIRRHSMPMPAEFAEEGQSARVLVVHDRAEAGALISLVMRAGFEAYGASSGLGAGLAIAEHRPDAVLFDLSAIEVDPWAAIAELRANAFSARLPALAAANPRDEKQQRRAAAAGFDAVVHKPLELDILKRNLDAALRARRDA